MPLRNQNRQPPTTKIIGQEITPRLLKVNGEFARSSAARHHRVAQMRNDSGEFRDASLFLGIDPSSSLVPEVPLRGRVWNCLRRYVWHHEAPTRPIACPRPCAPTARDSPETSRGLACSLSNRFLATLLPRN